MSLTGFRDLEVWQVAHKLALGCYSLSTDFPKSEVYGMTSQLRRCATSVPCNIAEGWGRRSTKEYLRHLSIANGSLEETRYLLLLATDLRYCSPQQHTDLGNLVNRVGAMLAALERSLKARLAGAGKRVAKNEEQEG